MKILAILFLGVLISTQAQAGNCLAKAKMLTDAGVPADLLNELGNKAKLGLRPAGVIGSEQNIAMIADFSQPSSKRRLYVIDLYTGSVNAQLTSHGRGSGKGEIAEKFSNKEKSEATALGLYRLAPPSEGNYGKERSTLIGFEASNSNAKTRGMIFHGCKFVSEREGRAGRSHGDFCVDPKVFQAFKHKVQDRETLLLAGKSTGKAVPDLAKNTGLCQLIDNVGLVVPNAVSEVPSDEELQKSNSAD